MVPFMSAIDKILRLMQRSPTGVRYAQLTMVCTYYFGDPRQAGTSHAVFKTPWPGDPRVNIQNKNGHYKPYQVKQVLAAIERLNENNHSR